ncbi:MAG: hypothetical protein LBH13_10530 [Cellulomonadaceae bacterium]|jgi:hypothetical protein|nr:hypothetical protein [Cellulomonadaceae bacterium]
MVSKNQRVERPAKKTEYVIVFASTAAAKGWRDLRATMLNALADAWDILTRDPKAVNATLHPLKGRLGLVTHRGENHVRRQYELPKGARIWYYVEDGKPGTVHIVDVFTAHPNQTK